MMVLIICNNCLGIIINTYPYIYIKRFNSRKVLIFFIKNTIDTINCLTSSHLAHIVVLDVDLRNMEI